jgi:hypothetical protein
VANDKQIRRRDWHFSGFHITRYGIGRPEGRSNLIFGWALERDRHYRETTLDLYLGSRLYVIRRCKDV